MPNHESGWDDSLIQQELEKITGDFCKERRIVEQRDDILFAVTAVMSWVLNQKPTDTSAMSEHIKELLSKSYTQISASAFEVVNEYIGVLRSVKVIKGNAALMQELLRLDPVNKYEIQKRNSYELLGHKALWNTLYILCFMNLFSNKYITKKAKSEETDENIQINMPLETYFTYALEDADLFGFTQKFGSLNSFVRHKKPIVHMSRSFNNAVSIPHVQLFLEKLQMVLHKGILVDIDFYYAKYSAIYEDRDKLLIQTGIDEALADLKRLLYELYSDDFEDDVSAMLRTGR